LIHEFAKHSQEKSFANLAFSTLSIRGACCGICPCLNRQ